MDRVLANARKRYVAVADPQFREELDEYRTKAVRGGGNTIYDLETALS